MRIQHNINALNANRNLTWNNNAVGKSLEKLSSGYRINRAGDDAAGLAISEKMRAQISCLTQAETNCNDGVSLIQTAEGALAEVHDMLNRMVELSEQSANGTYDNAVDRKNLQSEVEQLKDEIDRISEATNFNGINLLDGSLAGAGSTGSNLTGTQIVTYKNATTGAVAGQEITADQFVKEETLVVDGANIKVDWSKLTADEQAALTKDWQSGTVTNNEAKEAASIIEKAINNAIDESGLDVEHVTVKSTVTSGKASFEIKSGSADANSSVTINAAGNDELLGTLLTGDGTPVEAKAIINGAADMGGKFLMNIDGTDFTINMTAPTATEGAASAMDAHTKLLAAIKTTIGQYNTATNGGDTTAESYIDTKDITVDITSDGRLQITNNSGKNISFSDDPNETKTVATNLGISASAKVSGSGLTLQIGDTADDFNKLTVSIDSMSASSLGVKNVDISTQDGASKAIGTIKDAINKVSSTRGTLGAMQNRLEHTINNLSVTNENITNAESRIRDTDMAKEMMAYTSKNILSQAAQSMLAQANQQPQQVLSLLQ